jgi:hypothetical protein
MTARNILSHYPKLLAFAAIVLALALPGISVTALSNPVLPSGNSEDITVQIACAPASVFPVPVTLNYQGGTQTAVYGNNTTICPADAAAPLGFDGTLLPGISGFGNVTTATAFGVTVRRDGPTALVDRDGDGATDITIRIYYYQCCCYLEIRWVSQAIN